MKGLLVGFGSIGRRHLANFYDLGVEDWAVVHTGRGTLPLETPVPVRTYTDLDASLREERPDFAVVANPSSLHPATTTACIAAGCPVLIEKPISDSLDGLEQLAADAAAGAVGALVGFQFRFHPALHRIKALLTEGTIGVPLHARVVWGEYLPGMHPWEDWRTGYAARRDLGGGVHHTICHPLDYLRMLFGDPVSLSASLTENGPLGLDVAEAADVRFRFPNDVTVTLHLDYWTQPAMHRVEIVCTEGSIRWDYMAGEFSVWRQADGQWTSEEHPGLADRNELFVAEATHFLDVIAGRAEPVCTIADGVAVVQLCAAIEASAAQP